MFRKSRTFGFTLLRNGVKYDYPFIECLRSLQGVTEKIYLALGDSTDGTEDAIKSLSNIKIIPTIWNEANRSGGIILSEQTNIALGALRDDFSQDTNAWGIYLQCDEVFHEDDFELILSDIEKANEAGADSMSFRYLHFWMDHESIAINKKWYPQEVRAIRLSGKSESWGDAQGFRPCNNTYNSDARIFHYGHVREIDKYQVKKADILKLYHSDQKLSKYKKREKKFDDMTKVLRYLGDHPQFMRERLKRLGGKWNFPEKEKVFVVGNKEKYSSTILNKINAKEVVFKSSLWQVPKSHRKEAIFMEGGFFNRLFHCSKVPLSMESKLARNWPNDFLLTLKLSEKDISLKNPE